MENKITFENIQKANETIKTTEIKGKNYAEVNQRIKAFRMLYPQGVIKTEMLKCEDGICVFKAEIYDEKGTLLATGTAYERENSTFINKTSYIENCETSAVGRALGMCALGIDTSVASAEEVQNAMANQKSITVNTPSQTTKTTIEPNYRTELIKYCKGNNIDMKEVAKKYQLVGKKLSNDDYYDVLCDVKGGQNG